MSRPRSRRIISPVSTDNVNWAASDTATFGAGVDGSYGVTVGGAIATAANITFSNSGYALSAASAQTITLGGSISVASTKAATIGANVTVSKASAYSVTPANATKDRADRMEVAGMKETDMMGLRCVTNDIGSPRPGKHLAREGIRNPW